VVHALPRDAAGKPRTEILQLVAMNQLDLIEPLITSDVDRAFLKDILESRKNLRDRFNFESSELNSQSANRMSSPAKAGDPVFQRRSCQSRSRGVLDTPLRGYDGVCAAILPAKLLRPRRAPQVHKVRNRDVACGTKGSASARDMRSDRGGPAPAAGTPAAPAAARA
jgi:hypothetical protein